MNEDKCLAHNDNTLCSLFICPDTAITGKIWFFRIGYPFNMEWKYKATANKWRFWAPYDVAGAILAGMLYYEYKTRKILNEIEAKQSIAESAVELANDLKQLSDEY